MTWKRFPYYWPFVRGIHWSLSHSLNKRPVMQISAFIWCLSEQTIEMTIEWPVIWDTMMYMYMTSLMYYTDMHLHVCYYLYTCTQNESLPLFHITSPAFFLAEPQSADSPQHQPHLLPSGVLLPKRRTASDIFLPGGMTCCYLSSY